MLGRTRSTEVVAQQRATERDIAEQGRLASEQRLDKAFENAPIGIAMINREGRFIRANRSLVAITGHPEERMFAISFAEMVPPSHHAELERAFAAATTDPAAAFTVEHPVIQASGRTRWVSTYITSLSGMEEEPGLVLAQVLDITERMKAEADLEASERDKGMILETAHDAFISIDAHGRITGWNRSAHTVFGWTRAEAVGRVLADTIIPESLREAHRLGLERFSRLGEGSLTGQLLELAAIRRDGEEFPVELTILPSPRDDGFAFHAFLRDISERKRSEAELSEAHAQAIEASRLKSEFVANMSHEIRTPLNGVIGMSGLLMDTELSSEQREYVDAVRVSGDALLTVINDVLDFSKIEAGKLEVENEPFEVRPIVEEVASMIAAAAHAKSLEMIASADPGLPSRVCGDGHRVRQVLTNLMTNAVKFTARGEVIVRVLEDTDADSRPLLRFEVQDTGIGISADSLERVFESFVQQDESTTRRFGGTGLGLTISRLVELMGGEIGVRSTLGEGSTFWFTVPATGADPRPKPLSSAELVGARVLVVDDNAASLEFLEPLLVSWGLECRATADPASVPDLLQAAVLAGRTYDLLLVDSRMPSMSGEALTQLVRSTPALRSLRVLMLIAAGDAREWAVAAGVSGFVTKPVHTARLFEEVQRALAAGEAPASNGQARRVESAGRVPMDGPLVLVEEDNHVNQRVAVRLLEKRGYRVDGADNGHEAVKRFRRRPYTAVFMDCHMPELDGFGATAEIRRLEGSRAPVAIIAMTADTMAGDRERCLAAGMDDYIGKPVRPHALDAALARTVSGEAGADAVEFDAVLMHGLQGPGADPPLLDESTLDGVCGTDREARTGLIELFLDQAGAKVERLQEAVATADEETVRRLAHGLKGSAAAVGALRLAQTAHRLCEAARAGDLQDGVRFKEDVDRSFAGTCGALATAAVAGRQPLRPSPLPQAR